MDWFLYDRNLRHETVKGGFNYFKVYLSDVKFRCYTVLTVEYFPIKWKSLFQLQLYLCYIQLYFQ